MTKLSYHNLHIKFPGMPRTRLMDLPCSMEITCTRAGGWQLWQHSADPSDTAELLAGEYEGPDRWIVLDVSGSVICDSRK